MSSGKPEQVESHGASPGPPASGHEPDVFEWAEKAGIENMIGKHKTAEWLAQQASVTFTVLAGLYRSCPMHGLRGAKRPREALSANHCGPVSDSLWPVLSTQRHTLVLPFDGIKEDAKGTLRRDPGSAI